MWENISKMLDVNKKQKITVFGWAPKLIKEAEGEGHDVYVYDPKHNKKSSFPRSCKADVFIAVSNDVNLYSIFATIHNLKSKTGTPLIFIDACGLTGGVIDPTRFSEKGWIYQEVPLNLLQNLNNGLS